jgi:hypothetical protein
MHGIEQALPVKGTALEYDRYSLHFLLQEHLRINRYALMEKGSFRSLYKSILGTCPIRKEKIPRCLSASISE